MKNLLLFLAAATAAFAQAPVIATAVTSVQEGQTAAITCTANCTGLTWKVNNVTGGNSTVGTITGSGSTATYTAPASIVSNNTWGGCPAGFNDSVWNTPVSALPVISNWRGDAFLNEAWMKFYATFQDGFKGSIIQPLAMDDTFGTSFVNNGTPTINIMEDDGTPRSMHGIPFPNFPYAFTESGQYDYNTANNDHHTNMVNTDTCDLWETFNHHQDNSDAVACSNPTGGTCYHASSGGHMQPNKYTWTDGTDAGGGMTAPYLLHLSEIKSGVIKHAVHVRLPIGVDSPSSNLMWPATFGTGSAAGAGKDVVGLTISNGGSGYSAATVINITGGGGTGTVWHPVITSGVITGATMTHGAITGYTSTPSVSVTDTGGGTGAVITATIDYPALPYGSRLALDQTYLTQHTGASCPAGTNCLTGAGLVVATALANYGAIVLDNTCCGLFTFDGSQDIALDPGTEFNIKQALSTLSFSNFHILDQSGLAINASTNNATGCTDQTSGQPCSTAQVLPGNNLNYIPPGADWITATNGSGTSNVITVPLQPATIGTQDPMLWVLAGDYSGTKGTSGGYQIPIWVHGTTSTAFTCSLQASPAGSITAGGIYTPPVTLTTTGVQDVATCKLNSDNNVNAVVYINLLPNSGNYSANTIRADSGSSTNFGPDGNGHFWVGSVGMYAGDRSTSNDTWKYYSAHGEATIYATSFYPLDDIQYRFVVPNGNYRVRMMSGWDDQSGVISKTAWNHMPMIVSARDQGQGVIKGLHWNMMEHTIKVPYATQADSDFTFGVTVTDNTLDAGLETDELYQNGFTACKSGPQSGTCLDQAVIAGIDVEPDTTAAHWSIGVTNAVPQTNITNFVSDTPIVGLGKQLALYVQDWYTGLTDPVWSIVRGPGTLVASTTMLHPGYTIPIEQYTAPSASTDWEPVTIQARSQSNPAVSAIAVIYLRGTSGTGIQFK